MTNRNTTYKDTDPLKFLWNDLEALRGSGAITKNSAAAWLTVLYCKARNVTVKLDSSEDGSIMLSIDGEDINKHPVLAALTTSFDLRFDNSFLLCINHLRECPEDQIKLEFPDIVDTFLDVLYREIGKSGMMEYAQPAEVTHFISILLSNHKCKSVYNPFAGLCSYAIGRRTDYYISLDPQEIPFVSQELSGPIAALALLRLDAYKCKKTKLNVDDSIENWLGGASFDAIVATPPFGLTLKQYPKLYSSCKYAEDYFINKCTEAHPQKIAACVVSSSFCSRLSSKAARQGMIEDNSLEMVITLPKGLFAGTGISASIIIRSFETKHTSVRFVDASSMVDYDSRKKKELNLVLLNSVTNPNSFIYEEKKAEQYVKVVSYDDIRRQDFSLDSMMYRSTQAIPEGKHIEVLQDIAILDRGMPVVDKHHYAFILNKDDFKDTLDEALLPNNRDINEAPTATNKRHLGNAVACSFHDNKVSIFIHKGYKDFYSRPTNIVFKPRLSKVSLEYLAHLLLSNPQLNQMASRGVLMSSLENSALLSMQVLVDDDQQAAVDATLKEEREAKKKYLRSEGERLGLSSDVNDLVHMLGTSFTNQGEVFNYLQSPERKLSEDVALGIYALKEISDYMYRMITSFGQDLSVATYTRTVVKPTEFFTQFMNSWQFIGRKEFSLRLLPFDDYLKDVTISADSDKLKLLLETLLDNAYRHGFKKGDLKVPGGNQAAIMLELVMYHEKVYLRIAVMNNGAPLADGFTIKDFVKKGRFSKESGNTGLGGNHVYSIAKAHDGYLALTSDSEWNFIVEVLIPTVGLPNSLPSNINEYESECL